jgi:diguanylate cyclase (GGDEF)-like protein
VNTDELHALLERVYDEFSAESLDINHDDFLSYIKMVVKKFNNLNDHVDIDIEQHVVQYNQMMLDTIHAYDGTNKKIYKSVDNVDILENDPLDAVIDKFTSMNSEINDELVRANEKIKSLKDQVKDLEDKTNIDSLTQLLNRNAYQNYLAPLLDKAHMGNKELSLFLLLIDLDDFKQVNDTYGHLAGDKVLVYIAKLLRTVFRDTDRIFRFGGEEFAVVFNRVELATIEVVATRLLEKVRKNHLIYKNSQLRVTLSMGVAKHRSGDTLETLFDRADQAMYKAKNSGKDRLEIAK